MKLHGSLRGSFINQIKTRRLIVGPAVIYIYKHMFGQPLLLLKGTVASDGFLAHFDPI
jgi:hypothetical protein